MTEPLHIVQIAPQISPGSGVGMVAYALEREFQAVGAIVERFTLEDARGRPSRSSPSRLRLAWDVVWFSTVGTRRAKRFLAARPDAVSICHNDVMAGDIYVNHGILPAAMRARGHFALRMMRNPLHLFIAVRDRVRYRGGTHRAIVVLSSTEAALLGTEYGKVCAPITVIGNGVDLERFRPPTIGERAEARARLGFEEDDRVALFIGHEFDRKGLPAVMEALSRVGPRIKLLVVGGSEDMIAHAHAHASNLGAGERVVFAGEHGDVSNFLVASDMFVLPSAYEASALVLLEALASGLPVIATRAGSAPDIVEDGVNGYLVPRDAAVIADRMELLAADASSARRVRARESSLRYSWERIAQQYVALLESLRSDSTID